MSSGLNLSNGLHESITNPNMNVGTRKIIGLAGQIVNILLGQCVRRRANVHLDQCKASFLIGQWYVDALLETSTNGGVQHPGDVCGTKHQNVIIVVTHAYEQSN